MIFQATYLSIDIGTRISRFSIYSSSLLPLYFWPASPRPLPPNLFHFLLYSLAYSFILPSILRNVHHSTDPFHNIPIPSPPLSHSPYDLRYFFHFQHSSSPFLNFSFPTFVVRRTPCFSSSFCYCFIYLNPTHHITIPLVLPLCSFRLKYAFVPHMSYYLPPIPLFILFHSPTLSTSRKFLSIISFSLHTRLILILIPFISPPPPFSTTPSLSSHFWCWSLLSFIPLHLSLSNPSPLPLYTTGDPHSIPFYQSFPPFPFSTLASGSRPLPLLPSYYFIPFLPLYSVLASAHPGPPLSQ